jgi:glycosyltransferase involved in cell wall biosynthesis
VRILRQEQPDVIVSFLWFTNVVAILCRFFSGVPCKLVLSERSTIQGSREGFLNEILRRFSIRFLYPAADRVVPNSEGLRRQLTERYRLPARKVSVVQNPLEIEEIVAQGEDGRRGDARPSGLPLVLGIGRLTREKGFDLLICAAAEARRPFRLVLLGEGRGKKNLRDLAGRLGVADRVEFAGFHENPYAWLHNTAVFVLPSRYEGFPNSLLEAMALGVPCVATRCPTGPEEIVTDGVDGLLVPVEDPGALAAAIDRLLGDPELRERLGRAARERVRAYDAQGIVRRFEALIEEVTG